MADAWLEKMRKATKELQDQVAILKKGQSREHQVKYITSSFLMRMSYEIEIHPQYIMEQLGKYRAEDGKPLLVLSI